VEIEKEYVMRSMFRCCIVFGFCLGVAMAATPLEALVRGQLQPKIDAHSLAGAAVAVVQGDTTTTFQLGLAHIEKATPVTDDTLFEIGSITKVFTGTLLSLMIQDGAVALDTPVQSLLPAGVTVPVSDARAITLKDLTTHTSGLPRMPGNFAPKDEHQPYVDYTTASLYEFLNACKPKRAPGMEMEYSNVASALLGHALSLKADTPYEAAVRARIWEPLGMKDTWIGLSEAQLPRLAQGYTTSNQIFRQVLNEESRWDFDVFVSAGGIRSTITDMVKFLRANMQPDSMPLGTAMKAAQMPLFHIDGPRSVGMNWMLSARPTGEAGDVWHNGQTGGYHSFLAIDPIRWHGVVILANTATDIDDAGWKILAGLEELAGN